MSLNTPSTAGLVRVAGRIREQGGSVPLPAWVRITDGPGTVLRDAGVHESLRGFPCDGSFEIALAPGVYEFAIHRLISHEWFVETLVLEAGVERTLDVELKPWCDPAERGFFGGESHDHLLHPQDAGAAARYCEALGISYLDACQPWMHHRPRDRVTSGEEVARVLESHSAGGFHLYFGAERPKKRFGHVWWTNLTPFADPFGEYAGWHDPDYVAFCKLPRASAEVDIQAGCPFTGELPFTSWYRYRRQGAVGVSAHPTSWWVDNAEQKLIHTNIATDMVYALLAGCEVDAIVAMGYDPDQIFYQNVWFRLLNAGYRLPACAEADGGLQGPHHIGRILGYTRTPTGAYSRTGIAEGLRTGRTVMTSGPFVVFSADHGRYQMGDEIRLDRPDHQLDIEAWSDPDPREFLSGLVVYRNGIPFLIQDLRAGKPRHVRLAVPVTEPRGRAWYVVKVYGSRFPAEDRFLDVFAYARLCEEEPHAEYRDLKQVALTNPIYFIPRDWSPPAPVRCRLHLETVPGARVVISELGEVRETLVADAKGRVETVVSPVAELTVTAGTLPPIQRSIFLDYDPVRRLVEYSYSGRWRAQTRSGMLPGQVPWWGFAFGALREKLQELHWRIMPGEEARCGPAHDSESPRPGL
jgi:hypothetical protein